MIIGSDLCLLSPKGVINWVYLHNVCKKTSRTDSSGDYRTGF